MWGRKIKRTRTGDLQLKLGEDERDLLRSLPGQLRELMSDEPDDPTLKRLFPPAYTADPDRQAEYRRLMGDDLKQRHLGALALMEETVDAERLTEEQASAWLSALNDLRLVLGTRLDVSEDMLGAEVDASDPRAPLLALYGYLSWLEEQVVEALAGGL
ncbi:MAG: DUF2017 domain-containing protein [Actinomycetota bacterium]|nr:DUF2017 domain-containing protein [Actinomycetota bacterium]